MIVSMDSKSGVGIGVCAGQSMWLASAGEGAMG